MDHFFSFDKRLGIFIPTLEKEWDQYDSSIQEMILTKWEHIRGTIPDRIKEIEGTIEHLQQQLYEEMDFERSCLLNQQIAEKASIINDLWIWYRSSETVTLKNHN